ncbi:MAG TPA: hypothetical protein VF691_18385 [Cytophagaceae bacterium]
MEESIEIPISYKGEEIIFLGIIVSTGYNYSIKVDINGLTVTFEPDEERHYRIMIDPLQANTHKYDLELLKCIASALEVQE